MRPPGRQALALVALSLAAASAGAAEAVHPTGVAGAPPDRPVESGPRIAIGPLRNDPASIVGSRLAAALCGTRRCVPGALLGHRLEADLARARRMGVDGALIGSLWLEPRGRVLSLALFTTGGAPARTWVLPLGKDGAPRPTDVERLARELDAALAVEVPVAATPTAIPAPTAPPDPTAVSDHDLHSAPLVLAPPPRASARRASRPWLVLQAGIESTSRSLRFPPGGTAPVGYGVWLPATPRLRLELHPLGRSGGVAAGLAAFAEWAVQGGVELQSGGRVHRASLEQLRGGLLWRLPAGRRLVAVPALAWERERFVVGPADGVKLPGLPDTRLEGGSASLGLEVTVAGGAVTLLAGGRGTWWWRAGELAGGAGFYPSGSALGGACWAGAEVALAGPLSLRLLGTAEVTRWSLGIDPSGAYTVRTARAQAIGGQASLRLGW